MRVLDNLSYDNKKKQNFIQQMEEKCRANYARDSDHFHRKHTTLQRGFKPRRKLRGILQHRSFIDCTTRTTNSKACDKKGEEGILFRQEERRYTAVKTQLMVNNPDGLIIHKANHNHASSSFLMICFVND